MRLLALLLFAVAGSSSTAPDHAELAFVSDGRIWAPRADGSERRLLFRGTQPAWSPDGSRLAYANRERSSSGTAPTLRPTCSAAAR